MSLLISIYLCILSHTHTHTAAEPEVAAKGQAQACNDVDRSDIQPATWVAKGGGQRDTCAVVQEDTLITNRSR